MEKIRVFVNYCDIEFEIRGYYLKGDSYDNTSSCIEDAEVLIQGVDVWEISSTKQYNDIVDLAIQEIES